MFLIKKFNKFNNNIAIIDENNKKHSYKEIKQEINIFSKIIKERRLCFILCQNDFSTIIAYLGFLNSGSVVALIDKNIKSNSLQNLIKIYEPDYIFASNEKNKDKFENYEKINSTKKYLFSRINTKKNKSKFHKDLCLLISTSGTTGSPKFVKLSYSNLESNTVSITKFLNIRSNDITITTLPLSYVYGLSILNTHLYRGGKIILNNSSVIQPDFWKKLNLFKVTNFGGVPYLYKLILKLKYLNNSYPNLKYLTIAGGKLEEKNLIELNNILKKNKTKLIVMYGAAEATARMSYLPYEYFEKKTNSIGIAIPGGKLKIQKNVKKEGEIIFEGKNVFMGYAKNTKDLSTKKDNNLKLKTGDIGFKDKDGFFFIKGRKDRYVKIYGLRVNLDEIQNILLGNNIENICKFDGENKILVLLKNNINKDKIKKIILDHINLHPSIFRFRKVKKFKISKNFKVIL